MSTIEKSIIPVIDLDDPELQFMSSDEILELVQTNILTIQVPLRRCWSYLDIISDYLDASYTFETLSKIGKTSDYRQKSTTTHSSILEIDIINFNPKELATALPDLAMAIHTPEDNDLLHSDLFHQIREKVNLHEFTLMDSKLRYPDIVEDFFSNRINGAYYECGRQTFGSELIACPEREYGFWESAYCAGQTDKILISQNAWIVPESVTLNTAFKIFGYPNDMILLEGEFITCNNTSYILTENRVLEISLGLIIQALSCYSDYSSDKDDFEQRLDNLHSELFAPTPELKRMRKYFNSEELNEEEYRSTVLVSEFYDFVVFNFSMCSVVSFDIETLNKDEGKHVSNILANLSSNIIDELKISEERSINWPSIDEEIFEQLCWNIIYHHSRFDRNTIRKMGKSKSRDGGRDIEVWTKASAGAPSEKYIFQCKFSKNTDRSITANNVGPILEVMGEYGANGYGLFCNCYIDSTLFNRLDGFKRNEGKERETWDRFQIEKFLSRRPTLLKKFFI